MVAIASSYSNSSYNFSSFKKNINITYYIRPASCDCDRRAETNKTIATEAVTGA